MFWIIILVALAGWGAATLFAFTLGGFIHIVPVAVVVVLIVKRMSKAPNTEFGRWKSAALENRKR